MTVPDLHPGRPGQSKGVHPGRPGCPGLTEKPGTGHSQPLGWLPSPYGKMYMCSVSLCAPLSSVRGIVSCRLHCLVHSCPLSLVAEGCKGLHRVVCRGLRSTEGECRGLQQIWSVVWSSTYLQLMRPLTAVPLAMVLILEGASALLDRTFSSLQDCLELVSAVAGLLRPAGLGLPPPLPGLISLSARWQFRPSLTLPW